MPARRIDGTAHAARLEEQTAQHAAHLAQRTGSPPSLHVILVGDDAGSQVYVKRKTEACKRAGIETVTHRLPAQAKQAEVAALVDRLNKDDEVDGILLQLPLPSHLDKAQLLDRIEPAKDVDCFHPANVGLALIGRAPMPPPTPNAVLHVLEREGVRLRGANIVIVNHSNLIGKPLAALLINRDATVTICNKDTQDLKAHTRSADVVISGTGVAGLITADHIRPGAVVVDVGFARTPEGKLCGDVVQEEIREKAEAYTPVPGGIGPVTVAMLLKNATTAATMRRGVHAEA